MTLYSEHHNCCIQAVHAAVFSASHRGLGMEATNPFAICGDARSDLWST